METIHRRADRRPIRLKNYDYSQAGAYFVTVCSYQRRPVFGTLENGKIIPNHLGLMVQDVGWNLASMGFGLQIDTFQLMPDHLHAIFFLEGERLSLIQLMQKYKSFTTACYRQTPLAKETSGRLWHRGYYEHVIRNDKDLSRVREYIMNNPMKAHIDANHLW